ncbi:MAG: cysteine desulfurase, partial [Frankiales bacterium]|nr:cysteine desulfurase [Frankiales bacterium]
MAAYFDAAAGLPAHPIAVEAQAAASGDGWADPSRLTGPGRRAAVLLDAARQAMAEQLQVAPDEVSFVPSAVQATHLAVLGALRARRRAGTVLLHSAVEHSAVLKAAEWHLERGGLVEVAAVDSLGRVDAEDFVRRALAPGVAVAVLQAANHEVGTRQPVDVVASRLAAAGVPLVVDATHEILYGEPPANVPIFTVDARLWGGPAGVAVLVIRRGTRWQSPFPGDEAESGHSACVLNVAAAVAADADLRAFRHERRTQGARLRELVAELRASVAASIPDVAVLGDPEDRLPHLVTLSCLYVDGQSLLGLLDEQGFAVSSGSSCTSDTLTPSHVLQAMGALTSGNVRVSLHPGVTQAELERFAQVLPAAVAQVRAQAPGGQPPTATAAATATATAAATAIAAATATVTATAAATVTTTPSEAAVSAERVLDSRGRRCPLPILDLARAIPDVPVGGLLAVVSDDPAAATDVPAWSRMTGHEFVESSDYGHGA